MTTMADVYSNHPSESIFQLSTLNFQLQPYGLTGLMQQIPLMNANRVDSRVNCVQPAAAIGWATCSNRPEFASSRTNAPDAACAMTVLPSSPKIAVQGSPASGHSASH